MEYKLCYSTYAVFCAKQNKVQELSSRKLIMYGCESWTIKKARCQRIDAFELCCWRRLLRVLWIARRSNQSILKEINPEYSLEGLVLKLNLQNFGHLMPRADSLGKTLMLWKHRRKALYDRIWQIFPWYNTKSRSNKVKIDKLDYVKI